MPESFRLPSTAAGYRPQLLAAENTSRYVSFETGPYNVPTSIEVNGLFSESGVSTDLSRGGILLVFGNSSFDMKNNFTALNLGIFRDLGTVHHSEETSTLAGNFVASANLVFELFSDKPSIVAQPVIALSADNYHINSKKSLIDYNPDYYIGRIFGLAAGNVRQTMVRAYNLAAKSAEFWNSVFEDVPAFPDRVRNIQAICGLDTLPMYNQDPFINTFSEGLKAIIQDESSRLIPRLWPKNLDFTRVAENVVVEADYSDKLKINWLVSRVKERY